MQKSISGQLSQSFSHSPSRPSIRWKSRTRGSELPTNYQSLATISGQLKKATEDFERVNKTKELLGASNSLIRKKISRAISECQALKKNHEKLHNESMKVSKKTERLLGERVLIEKEYEGLGSEISAMEAAIEKCRKDIGKMRARMNEETTIVATLTDTSNKLRKETDKKLKERDAFKSDTAIISKQIEEINAAKRRASSIKPIR